MIHRIAASLALLAFAVCLLEGGFSAGNSFSTTILRALIAMSGTYCVGLVVGWAAQRMVQENLRTEEEKLRKIQKSQEE
ncbi:MAG: hypothetical protein ABSH20_21040 [Tepidisphaeraceae bacterium]|jgi:NhaP-type Na+/H+ or K+/H+ antiporter